MRSLAKMNCCKIIRGRSVAVSSTGTLACAGLQLRHQLIPSATVVAALLLAISSMVSAPPQDSTAPTQQNPLTPEASLNLRFLSDLQLSPDGTRLAFVVTEPPTDDGRATHIWLYDKRSNTARQFTYSKKSEKWPRWAPDGKQLAFLSNREGIPGEDQQQLYVMRGDGG